MVIDDPVRAAKEQIELESLSEPPASRTLLSIASVLPLPRPFNKIPEIVKDKLKAEEIARIRVMLEACIDETNRQAKDIKGLQTSLTEQQAHAREEVIAELVIDASRKAENTRSITRVKRIGRILANAAFETSGSDADQTEEMMRIAIDLTDRDVELLRELVRIEGDTVRMNGRIERYNAFTRWEQGKWGARIDPELDSVFSKLESYGLVFRLAPPNNLNILADYQNRYALLQKGLRFNDSIRSLAASAT
ncbi:MAG: hypothetical protein WB460_21930 [Candidatus Acidiferrales bacterium]